MPLPGMHCEEVIPQECAGERSDFTLVPCPQEATAARDALAKAPVREEGAVPDPVRQLSVAHPPLEKPGTLGRTAKTSRPLYLTYGSDREGRVGQELKGGRHAFESPYAPPRETRGKNKGNADLHSQPLPAHPVLSPEKAQGTKAPRTLSAASHCLAKATEGGHHREDVSAPPTFLPCRGKDEAPGRTTLLSAQKSKLASSCGDPPRSIARREIEKTGSGLLSSSCVTILSYPRPSPSTLSLTKINQSPLIKSTVQQSGDKLDESAPMTSSESGGSGSRPQALALRGLGKVEDGISPLYTVTAAAMAPSTTVNASKASVLSDTNASRPDPPGFIYNSTQRNSASSEEINGICSLSSPLSPELQRMFNSCSRDRAGKVTAERTPTSLKRASNFHCTTAPRSEMVSVIQNSSQNSSVSVQLAESAPLQKNGSLIEITGAAPPQASAASRSLSDWIVQNSSGSAKGADCANRSSQSVTSSNIPCSNLFTRASSSERTSSSENQSAPSKATYIAEVTPIFAHSVGPLSGPGGTVAGSADAIVSPVLRSGGPSLGYCCDSGDCCDPVNMPFAEQRVPPSVLGADATSSTMIHSTKVPLPSMMLATVSSAPSQQCFSMLESSPTPDGHPVSAPQLQPRQGEPKDSVEDALQANPSSQAIPLAGPADDITLSGIYYPANLPQSSLSAPSQADADKGDIGLLRSFPEGSGGAHPSPSTMLTAEHYVHASDQIKCASPLSPRPATENTLASPETPILPHISEATTLDAEDPADVFTLGSAATAMQLPQHNTHDDSSAKDALVGQPAVCCTHDTRLDRGETQTLQISSAGASGGGTFPDVTMRGASTVCGEGNSEYITRLFTVTSHADWGRETAKAGFSGVGNSSDRLCRELDATLAFNSTYFAEGTNDSPRLPQRDNAACEGAPTSQFSPSATASVQRCETPVKDAPRVRSKMISFGTASHSPGGELQSIKRSVRALLSSIFSGSNNDTDLEVASPLSVGALSLPIAQQMQIDEVDGTVTGWYTHTMGGATSLSSFYRELPVDNVPTILSYTENDCIGGVGSVIQKYVTSDSTNQHRFVVCELDCLAPFCNAQSVVPDSDDVLSEKEKDAARGTAIERVLMDLSCLQRMGHRGMHNLYEVQVLSKKIRFLTDYSAHGSLKGKRLTEMEVAVILLELIRVLRYTHANGIAHCHIHPSSLFPPDGEGAAAVGEPAMSGVDTSVAPRQVILGGLGLSHFFLAMSPWELWCMGMRNLSIFPPERLADSPPPARFTEREKGPRELDCEAIDLWGLGITAYVLLYGKSPFDLPSEESPNDAAQFAKQMRTYLQREPVFPRYAFSDKCVGAARFRAWDAPSSAEPPTESPEGTPVVAAVETSAAAAPLAVALAPSDSSSMGANQNANFSEQLEHLIRTLLSKDPTARGTLRSALRHPCLQQVKTQFGHIADPSKVDESTPPRAAEKNPELTKSMECFGSRVPSGGESQKARASWWQDPEQLVAISQCTQLSRAASTSDSNIFHSIHLSSSRANESSPVERAVPPLAAMEFEFSAGSRLEAYSQQRATNVNACQNQNTLFSADSCRVVDSSGDDSSEDTSSDDDSKVPAMCTWLRIGHGISGKRTDRSGKQKHMKLHAKTNMRQLQRQLCSNGISVVPSLSSRRSSRSSKLALPPRTRINRELLARSISRRKSTPNRLRRKSNVFRDFEDIMSFVSGSNTQNDSGREASQSTSAASCQQCKGLLLTLPQKDRRLLLRESVIDAADANEVIERSHQSGSHEVLIANASLVALPTALFVPTLVGLTVLDVAHNKLEQLSKDIKYLINMRRLLVSDNRLISLPEEIGCLSDLEVLDVTRNKLQSLPDSLSLCYELHTLKMDYNDFTGLPDLLTELCVTTVFIAENPRITSLPPIATMTQYPASITVGLDNEPNVWKSYERIKDSIPNVSIIWNKIYPDEIIPGLFCGSLRSAQTQRVYERLGIQYVLTVARELIPNPPENGVHKTINVDDLEGVNIKDAFEEAMEFIDEALKRKVGCLVHCFAGMSRSAATVIAYLMMRKGMRLDEAYVTTRRGRPAIYPNAGFFKQLVALDAELYPSKRPLNMESMEREKIPNA